MHAQCSSPVLEEPDAAAMRMIGTERKKPWTALVPPQALPRRCTYNWFGDAPGLSSVCTHAHLSGPKEADMLKLLVCVPKRKFYGAAFRM